MRSRVEVGLNVIPLASISRKGEATVVEPSYFPVRGEIRFRDSDSKLKDTNQPAVYKSGGGIQGLKHWHISLKESAKLPGNKCPKHLFGCNCASAEMALPTLN